MKFSLEGRCAADTLDSQFSNLVESGRLRNRSIQLKQDAEGKWRLGHVAFLGAEPPAAVAGDHGLDLRMPPPPPTFHLPHLDQSSESDLHLLTRLARRWDYVFKVSGKRLVFVPAGQGLTFPQN